MKHHVNASQHQRRGQNPPIKPASEHYGHNAQPAAGDDDLDAAMDEMEVSAAHEVDRLNVNIATEDIAAAANGPADNE